MTTSATPCLIWSFKEQQSAGALLRWAEAEGAAFTEPPSGSFVLPAGSFRASSWSRRSGAERGEWWSRGGREKTGEKTKTLLSSWRLLPLLGKNKVELTSEIIILYINVYVTCFCPQLIKRRGRDFLLQHCPALHVELTGVSRSQAVLRFIKEASSLRDASVTFYRMRRVSHSESNCLKKRNLPEHRNCNEVVGN